MKLSQEIDSKTLLPLLSGKCKNYFIIDPKKKDIFFKRLTYQIENIEGNIQRTIDKGIKSVFSINYY